MCIRDSSCSAGWENYTDTAANAVVLRQEYTTLDACLIACRYLVSGCVAAQWRAVSSDCFFVYDINSFYGRYPASGVDLYYVSVTCVTTGKQ